MVQSKNKNITLYKVYILRSLKTRRHYIGHTNNLEDRLKRHNQKRVKSTKNGIPWKIIYTENCRNKSEAFRRELEIKNYKCGIKFKKLVGLWKNGEVA